MAVACIPALVTAGCIEAFVSPSAARIRFKAGLVLTLSLSFWGYLLLHGKTVLKVNA